MGSGVSGVIVERILELDAAVSPWARNLPPIAAEEEVIP
jgi:hypothetical protein